ncbi:hypothetical protein, partial [Salmonella sp. s51228]|uniref:hypothetical protein n=1 Tax=Salmonella sp. s51228 TaxID=3159652 RepID=UPI0039818C00
MAIKILIIEYRENAELRAAVDLVQNYLACCGSQSFLDWDQNVYFNCNATGDERCGVPTSCCIMSQQLNNQCGFNVRQISQASRLANINQAGCITNFKELVISNLYAVGG